MPNGPANTDAQLFCTFFPFFCSACLSFCLCLFLSAHSVLVLYIPSCCQASFILLSLWILSYIFSSLSELIFCLFTTFFPLRLSHSAIADTLYFRWILGRKDICVCFTIYESVYICFYIRVSVFTVGEQWLNSLSFVFLARPGGVWQWTKC